MVSMIAGDRRIMRAPDQLLAPQGDVRVDLIAQLDVQPAATSACPQMADQFEQAAHGEPTEP